MAVIARWPGGSGKAGFHCIIGDKKHKISMATLGAKFLGTISKSETHDCKRNLSPLIIKCHPKV